jgi:hypothetical protein
MDFSLGAFNWGGIHDNQARGKNWKVFLVEDYIYLKAVRLPPLAALGGNDMGGLETLPYKRLVGYWLQCSRKSMAVRFPPRIYL